MQQKTLQILYFDLLNKRRNEDEQSFRRRFKDNYCRRSFMGETEK